LLRPSKPHSERLAVDDDGVAYVSPDGQLHVVRWTDLEVAAVETTVGGPFIEDVYFYLEGSKYGFFIPEGAEGTDELVRRLVALPGFDGASFSDAMRSTANARFVCWRRSN
jgi:hypothetical protein